MRLTYVGPFDRVEVPALNAIVRRGEQVDAPDELAVAMLEQPVWTASPRDLVDAAGDPDQARRLLDAERRRESPRDAVLDELQRRAEPAVEAEQAGDEVPDAKAAVVLAWVGDDRDRAGRALAAEQQRDQPRDNVIGPLEQLLATTEETH